MWTHRHTHGSDPRYSVLHSRRAPAPPKHRGPTRPAQPASAARPGPARLPPAHGGFGAAPARLGLPCLPHQAEPPCRPSPPHRGAEAGPQLCPLLDERSAAPARARSRSRSRPPSPRLEGGLLRPTGALEIVAGLHGSRHALAPRRAPVAGAEGKRGGRRHSSAHSASGNSHDVAEGGTCRTGTAPRAAPQAGADCVAVGCARPVPNGAVAGARGRDSSRKEGRGRWQPQADSVGTRSHSHGLGCIRNGAPPVLLLGWEERAHFSSGRWNGGPEQDPHTEATRPGAGLLSVPSLQHSLFFPAKCWWCSGAATLHAPGKGRGVEMGCGKESNHWDMALLSPLCLSISSCQS